MMTNLVILILCILVILSYLFDITARYSKVPGVILLILLGILIQIISQSLNIMIPNLRPLLPVIGTLGLIMIVLEASLDLKIEKGKKGLIIKSVSSAFILFALFTAIMSFILVRIDQIPVRTAILNSIPLAIISSAVAISAASLLKPEEKEFVVYESSFSDIIGIIVFDFIVISQGSVMAGVLNLTFNTVLTVIIALLTTSVLAILLHKITYHINYVIIMTSVVLVYALAKLAHLPALLLVLTFGLILSNSTLLENTPVKKIVDFEKFRNDISSFKTILSELTFLVRSFFFLIFGYYTKIDGLFSLNNLYIAALVTAGIFILRYIYIVLILRKPAIPLLFFAPRGLITILLFISIPASARISAISEELITLVILMSIVVLTFGNIIYKKDSTGLAFSNKSNGNEK
ncbi:MAG TPA: cation:proton antiporter [Bacteroidales bacterium]|nr:cation:proton antiporter [Bacteroidales bacterium]